MYRCMGCMKEYQENHQKCPYCGYDKNSATNHSHHLLPETILQGRYIVGKVLGVGGFGITYIGFDAELERVVAIKEFLPSMFATRTAGELVVTVYQGEATNQYTQGLKRFVDEARTLAQFNGIPGIVDIYDSFTSNNTAYIIMQFLKGQDVKQIMKNQGRLEYETAREMIIAICDTLEPVHRRGIIHRDISPDNIFITEEGEIKLLDFGAARYESAMNSKSLSVILKKGFAPEEQYRSRGQQGGWTDVYALAATFYKMVTGVTPQDSMERSIQDDLQLPSALGVEIPTNVEAAIIKALGVRRENRTQSAQEFRTDLMDANLKVPHAKPKEKPKEKPENNSWMKVMIGVVIVTLLGGVAIIERSQTSSTTPSESASSGFNIASLFEMDTVANVDEEIEEIFVEEETQEEIPDVTVPNVEGMAYEKAVSVLEEAGLEAEILSWEFSEPRDDSGIINYQVQSANTTVSSGSTIQLSVLIGHPENGVELGIFPAFEEMELGELLEIMDNYSNWNGVDYVINYAYSSEEEKGTLIEIRYYDVGELDITTSKGMYGLIIGLGEEDTGNNPYGLLTLASICDLENLQSIDEVDEAGVLRYIVASADGEANPSQIIADFLVTVDGGDTWDVIYSRETSGFSLEYTESISYGIGYIELLDVPNLYQDQYIGESLQFKISRYVLEDGEKVYIDSIEVDTALEIQYDGAIEVTEIEAINSEDFTGWKISGDLSESAAYELIEIVDGAVDGYVEESCFTETSLREDGIYISATEEEMQQYGGKEFLLKEKYNDYDETLYTILGYELGKITMCEPVIIELPTL